MPPSSNKPFMLCTLLAAIPLLSVSASSEIDPARFHNSQRDNTQTCNISPAWDLTTQAYTNAGTDQNFTSFWSSHNSGGARFDTVFGGVLLNESNLQCGVGNTTTCKTPDCLSIQQNGGQPWEYLAANSLVNLNSMFNSMHDGVGINSNTVQNILDQLSKHVFKWNSSSTFQQEVATWWPSVIAAVAMFGTSTTDGLALNTSFPDFSTAAASQVAGAIQQASSIKLNEKSEKDLFDTINLYTNATQNAITTWSATTFSGHNGPQNQDIFNYIANGRFVNPSSVPDNATVTQFFQTLLVANLANMLWRQQPVYLLSTPLNQTDLDPTIEPYAYTSPTTGRLYIPYFYKGNPLQLPGNNLFTSSGSGFYNVHISQVVESSAKAWEAAGSNSYTDAMELSIITTSISSDSSIWTQGASFSGIFRFPVCDIGSRIEWLVPYNKNGAPLPCCCGPYCTDSKAFVAATGLVNHYEWRTICLKQFANTALVVDWGIPAKNWFNGMSKSNQAWTIIWILFMCGCGALALFVYLGPLVLVLVGLFRTLYTSTRAKLERRWTLYSAVFEKVKQKINRGGGDRDGIAL